MIYREEHSMTMKRLLHTTIVVALCTVSVVAAVPLGAERILVAVSIWQTPGLHDSLWISSLLISNHSDTDVVVYYPQCQVDPCIDNFVVPAHRTIIANVQRAIPDAPGILLYVDPADANKINLYSRVADISRESRIFGTEMPVVREEDAFTDTVRLPGIPMDPRFRNMLRIYEFDAQTSIPFVVSVVAADGSVLATTTISAVPPTPQQGNLAPMFPGGVQIPDVLQRLGVTEGVSASIEVTPVIPGTKFFTFVSVTNNDTQQVTTITPN